MNYKSFDRIKIVHLQGELRAVLPGYYKRNSTLQVGNFDRPVYQMFSITSIVDRVPHIDPSESLRSCPMHKASRYAPRLAEWADMGHQTVHISSKVL